MKSEGEGATTIVVSGGDYAGGSAEPVRPRASAPHRRQAPRPNYGQPYPNYGQPYPGYQYQPGYRWQGPNVYPY